MDKRRKVTRQEVIDSYYKNFKKHSKVAKELNISRERVRQILSAAGLKTETNLERDTKIKALALLGRTQIEIANELNLTTRTVKKVATELGLELVKGRHPNIKHTKEMLIELYNRFEGHYSKIANHLDIPQPVVSRLFKVRGLREDYPSQGRQQNTKRD